MEIIGIDHGYAAIKTKNFCFPSGVVEYGHEPYTQRDVLEYGGKYYVCGSGRQALLKDKTANDNYYLLTLAAIAKEIRHRGLSATQEVVIAAGLPLSAFGREKKSFRDYFLRGKRECFKYEGTQYDVLIEDVSLFPQGYSDVLSHMDILQKEPSVILCDIGGWTVDVMLLNNVIPDAATCRSLELGMIRCIGEIQEQLRRSLGLSLTQIQIETVPGGNSGSVRKDAVSIIEKQGWEYVEKLLSALSESGFDVKAMPAIFMGGGAALLDRHVAGCAGLCRVILSTDVCANAVGFERLCGQMRGNGDE